MNLFGLVKCFLKKCWIRVDCKQRQTLLRSSQLHSLLALDLILYLHVFPVAAESSTGCHAELNTAVIKIWVPRQAAWASLRNLSEMQIL